MGLPVLENRECARSSNPAPVHIGREHDRQKITSRQGFIRPAAQALFTQTRPFMMMAAFGLFQVLRQLQSMAVYGSKKNLL